MLLAASSLLSSSLVPAGRPVGSTVVARSAPPIAQFGTGNFDRAQARRVEAAKVSDPTAKPDFGGLAVLTASAVVIPLVFLSGIYSGGPGKKTPFTFTDSISPAAVAERDVVAKKRAAFEAERAAQLKKEAEKRATVKAKESKGAPVA